jgi:OHCU decarboxylase
MDRDAFVHRYGGIYEHSPWVAERSYDEGQSMAPDALTRVFRHCVDSASDDEKLALIRAHPDLAGRAAMAGELTAASGVEQASAGIDQCTAAEYEEFQSLNTRYKDKFGFPFVMAVRNSDRHDILAAFRARLDRSPEEEFATAIREIHEIARMRLEAL